MKFVKNLLAFCALTVAISGQSLVHAQGFGGALNAGIRVIGAVTEVDGTNDLVTVAGRGPNAYTTTVKYDADTKYSKQAVIPITNLKVGDIISVNSATPVQPGDTSVDATRIAVLPELPPAMPAPPVAAIPNATPAGTAPAGAGQPGGPGGVFGRRGGRPTAGTVATTTPTLTITTQAGDTLTVNTTAATTVIEEQEGSIADVVSGATVAISAKTDSNAVLTATQVNIIPTRQPKAPAAQ